MKELERIVRDDGQEVALWYEDGKFHIQIIFSLFFVEASSESFARAISECIMKYDAHLESRETAEVTE